MKTAREWALALDGIAFSKDIEKIQQDARAELVEALAGIIAIAGTLEDDNSANFHAMQKIIQRAKEACAPPVGKETT
jgi:hypothetical protein